MAFKIITDSASDSSKEMIEKYNLHVIPTPVVVDGEDYRDGESIFPDDFYKMQAEGREISTYHVSQYMFEEAFRPYAAAGDEVLYICFSTGIAGTFQAANLAKNEILEEYPDFKITIIDSKCASMGYGLVVYKLLKMQENGADKDLIIEAAQYFCDHMKHLVAVRTLDYLHKGGRISKTSAVVGTMIDIKPIIHVNEEGSLAVCEKVRGWNKAINRIVALGKEQGYDFTKQTIACLHGNDEESYDKLIGIIEKELQPKEILKGRIGCAIGAHTGPGIVAFVFEDAVDEKFEKYL